MTVRTKTSRIVYEMPTEPEAGDFLVIGKDLNGGRFPYTTVLCIETHDSEKVLCYPNGNPDIPGTPVQDDDWVLNEGNFFIVFEREITERAIVFDEPPADMEEAVLLPDKEIVALSKIVEVLECLDDEDIQHRLAGYLCDRY